MPITVTEEWEGRPKVLAFTFVGRPADPTKLRRGKMRRSTYMITGRTYTDAKARVVAHMRESIGTRDIEITVTCP